jgi:NarL family two-component system response regulator YdfI
LAVRLGLTALVEDDTVVVGSGAYPEELTPFISNADVLLVYFEEELWPRWSSEVFEFDLPLVLLGAPSATATPVAKGSAILSPDATGEEIVAAAFAASQGLFVYDSSTLPLTATPAVFLEEPAPLTAREVEILQLMADGLPNKQIASRLQISIHTVKFHVAATLSKLGAASRTEAVTLGMRQGHIRL